MRPSVFAILVVAVTTAYFVNPNDAIPTVELCPVSTQRVCQRDTVSFNCRTNGDTVVFSVPGVDADQIFSVSSTEGIQTCRPTTNFATTCRLLEDATDNTTFTGTLLYYIQPDQSNGTFNVSCNAFGNGGNNINYTQLQIDKAITETVDVNNMSVSCYRVNNTQGDNDTLDSESMDMYIVNITWPSSANVEQFEVILNDTRYKTSQNHISLNLLGQNYTIYILAENGCGTYNYTNSFVIDVDPDMCSTIIEVRNIFLPSNMPICPPECIGICCGVAIIFLIIGHGSGGAIGYVIRSKKKCKPEQSVKTSDHKLSETSEIKCEKF